MSKIKVYTDNLADIAMYGYEGRDDDFISFLNSNRVAISYCFEDHDKYKSPITYIRAKNKIAAKYLDWIKDNTLYGEVAITWSIFRKDHEYEISVMLCFTNIADLTHMGLAFGEMPEKTLGGNYLMPGVDWFGSNYI